MHLLAFFRAWVESIQATKFLKIFTGPVYGKTKNHIKDFQISTHPASKTTCQGDRTNKIVVPWYL